MVILVSRVPYLEALLSSNSLSDEDDDVSELAL
jgi:hypothetical protein